MHQTRFWRNGEGFRLAECQVLSGEIDFEQFNSALGRESHGPATR